MKTLANRLQEKTTLLNKAEVKIKTHEREIKLLSEQLHATQVTLTETEKKLITFYRKLERGASWVYLENGFVKEGGMLPPNAILLYGNQIEVAPKELLKGYVKFENGKVIVDEDMKQKYINTFKGGQ